MGILEEAEEARERGLSLAREKAALLYVAALDRGDFSTVAAILQQAEQDTELEQMIIEIDNALYEEMSQEQERGH